jgi:hypothetical protein
MPAAIVHHWFVAALRLSAVCRVDRIFALAVKLMRPGKLDLCQTVFIDAHGQHIHQLLHKGSLTLAWGSVGCVCGRVLRVLVTMLQISSMSRCQV